MAEPLARMDTGGAGVLAEAAQRLDLALQALEAALGHGRPAPLAATAQVVELEAARRRSRELETAAGEASQALGDAMAQVRQALMDDEMEAQDPQASLFDAGLPDPGLLEEGPEEANGLDSPLESGTGLADDRDETQVAGPAPYEEPTE